MILRIKKKHLEFLKIVQLHVPYFMKCLIMACSLVPIRFAIIVYLTIQTLHLCIHSKCFMLCKCVTLSLEFSVKEL